jgi:hypothetical protein
VGLHDRGALVGGASGEKGSSAVREFKVRQQADGRGHQATAKSVRQFGCSMVRGFGKRGVGASGGSRGQDQVDLSWGL